jgi:AbrB family looped-hinge helix DNA binding protein
MKVTRNRQITIPGKISEELGIREGDRVIVRLEGNKIVMEKVRSLKDLSGTWGPEMDKIMATVRKRWVRWL